MAALEGRFDFKTAEPALQQRWDEAGIYRFDPHHPGPPFTVDTPPPTVSGRIHVGHVYSYTQADVMIRYHRMKGEQVFYPFGFDDNGLPTEIFTENSKGIRARDVGRRAFIEACLALSQEVEGQFERFWKRLGLSVDWRLRYSTIDDRSRRVSQAAFLDLYRRDNVYRQEAPTLWCTTCQTGVAQADVEDKPGEKAFFTTFPFQLLVGQSSRTREAALDTATATRTASAPQMASAPQVEMGPNELLIATTRPELLAACVAVFVHPTDARYRDVVGKTARTPIFDLEVPVLADPRADPEKGTGAVMCCTFGDVADVAWWRDHKLPLRLAITEDGHMNDSAGPYAGLTVRAARARILEDLRATGLIREQIQIEHTVGVHDRGGHDLEYLVTKQWFVKLLEHKERWLEAGRQIRWHPEYMRTRYENWIEGLSWDWNISRQKTYGVAFPVWYCCACGAPVLAAEAQLPVDPQETPPPLDACPACGGKEFDPDTDVMDTWATSSVTPQICATLLEPLGISAPEFEQRFRPMSLRPNAHDIIRTWDFYTIVRSLYHSGGIPWTDVLISGHALDPSRKKISKSKLQVAEDPFPMLEQFSADAVRYWAASVRTAGDTALSEDVFRNGNKLVTKLWHASKFALSHLTPGETAPEAVVNGAALNATDRWLLARLHEVIRRATTAMEEYEFATAKAEVERFFWMDLCDNYLELIKLRIYGDVPAANGRNGDAPTTAPVTNGRNGDARTGDGSGAAGARYVLSQAVPAVLKLLAPFMPHITEAIFMSGFAASAGVPSIHVSRWPDAPADWDRPAARQSGAVILEVVETVRRWKAERQLSVGARVGTLRISCPAAQWDALSSARLDLQGVAQAQAVEIVTAPEDSPLHVSVQEAQPEPVRAGA